MEGVHQIAVRILTLTEIFSSTFHRYFNIILSARNILQTFAGLGNLPRIKKAYPEDMLLK